MGCDIHLWVEVRENGTWRLKDDRGPPPDDETCTEWQWRAWRDAEPDYLWTRRSYNLFAILANVRNGRGFVGVKTGEGFNPIALPKGLPADASPEVKQHAEHWGGDGHSHSYLTVYELDHYDWEQRTTLQGVVTPEEFANWKAHGEPNEWSGGVSGARVRMLTNEEMEREIQRAPELAAPPKPGFNNDSRLYTTVRWTKTYAKAVNEFYTVTLPALRRLGKPLDVRIVFFFDN